jgi:adenosylcobinamide-phosphate synthase
VQLGGANKYKNKIKLKPLLGEPHQPINLATVKSSLKLMRYSLLLLLALGILVRVLISHIRMW